MNTETVSDWPANLLAIKININLSFWKMYY